jgi:hypothetical protein
MDYTARFSATLEKGVVDFIVTVIVPVTTLCPCSKAISIHGAHNQRGQVTYSIRFQRPIWIEDLIRLVEDCASCELYSLLKRPDEKAVTERAYDNPVFVEDLVRNIAARSEQSRILLVSRGGGEFRVDPQSQRLRVNRKQKAVSQPRRDLQHVTPAPHDAAPRRGDRRLLAHDDDAAHSHELRPQDRPSARCPWSTC